MTLQQNERMNQQPESVERSTSLHDHQQQQQVTIGHHQQQQQPQQQQQQQQQPEDRGVKRKADEMIGNSESA
ncbi:hypothetical protein PUN28_001049 [Cardiocondyla obscurior]|uniref:Uncharacterized protein n=1 Tax=Cardiocondyla obscurior TaxID=286306 RepID=A0AAW2H2K2_9HYME